MVVMSRFHTIVAAVDFSETSQDALDAALDLVRGKQGHVHLVHVVPDPFNQPWVVESPGVDLVQVQQTWVQDAELRLGRLMAGRGVPADRVTSTVLVGPATSEIVRYASEQSADVIVLGSHGHGAVRRFLLGSVADRVIRQATCPVMVVPHRTLRAAPAEVELTAAVAR